MKDSTARAASAVLAVILAVVATAQAAELACATIQPGTPYTYCRVLSSKAAIAWYHTSSDITIKLLVKGESRALDWMAIGFSQLGSMTGSDMWIVVRKNRTAWAVIDAQAEGFVTPTPDAKGFQDVVLRSVAHNAIAGVWSAVMSRKLKTCDLDFDLEVKAGRDFYVLWAYGKSFQRKAGFRNIQYHDANRGSMRVELVAETAPPAALDAPPPEQVPQAQPPVSIAELTDAVNEFIVNAADRVSPSSRNYMQPSEGRVVAAASAAPAAPPKVTQNPDGTFWMDLMCPKLTVPGDDVTTYMICYVELPTDQKYHITEVTSIWNSLLVHHSLVYGCSPDIDQPLVEDLIDRKGAGPHNLKDEKNLCLSFFLIGPHPYGNNTATTKLPDNTGQPMGKGVYKYASIEIHYNNPKLVFLDDPGTGLRVKFQPASWGAQDIGVLTVSQTLLNIPPGQETVVADVSTCTAACTNRLSQPVTMISSVMHTHNLGKSMLTKWVRNGVELEPISTLKRNDNDFQTYLDIPASQSKLYPGDELSLTCTYDSRSRTDVTRWGYGFTDEMCFWWIFYYPAQPDWGICSQASKLLPFTVCSSTGKDAQEMREAANAGNTSNVIAILQTATAAGRAIFPDTIGQITKPYNPKRGCSARRPKL